MVSFLGITKNKVFPDNFLKRGLIMKTCYICHKLRDKQFLKRVYSFIENKYLFVCSGCNTYKNRLEYRYKIKE